jgi:hypothetical protein
MSTTTIRLPAQEEVRADFYGTGDARFEAIMASGKAISWTDMRRYLVNRAAGKGVAPPTAKKLAR